MAGYAFRAPPPRSALESSVMGELSRIGVAIDSELLDKFDALIAERGYTNRSEAFRDLIRSDLVEKRWESPTATWSARLRWSTTTTSAC